MIIQKQEDVQNLKGALDIYERASSARLNWDKTEAVWYGSTENTNMVLPKLPNNIQWGTLGLKYLGVYLGQEEYKKKNWEGLVEKVCARLSSWKWLLPQLSYRGRVLIANNLIASMLWHKMMVVDPPVILIQEIQKRLVNFFWSGQHWLRAAVLYLPVQEGGQGLIDIRARLTVFRLQAIQRLLYQQQHGWMELTCALLRKAGRMGLDKQLFTMTLKRTSLGGLNSFYLNIMDLWQMISVSREWSKPGPWLFNESLFFNPLFPTEILNSDTIRSKLLAAGTSMFRDLRIGDGWIEAEELARKVGFRSVRLAKRVLEDLEAELPVSAKEFLKETCAGEDTEPFTFPEFDFLMKRDYQEEDPAKLLSLNTPEMGLFNDLLKRTLYTACVKTMNYQDLKDQTESKWTLVLGSDSSPKGSWRALYKKPTEKRVGDLQWRIVHGV